MRVINMPIMNTVRAIYNPIAGRRDLSCFLKDCASRLRQHGFELNTTPTQGPGDATRLAREAPDDAHAVIAVGGDGTCRDVACGLLNRPTPMMVIPAGNENILAKYIRSKASIDQIVETLIADRTEPYDVGTINSNPFLLMTGVGFDAEAVQRVTTVRKGHISYLTYTKPLWQTFWDHQFPRLRVHVDEELVFEGHGLAFVGVMPRYAIGLRLLANAQHNDGLLDICVMSCQSKLQLVGLSMSAALGRHTRRAGVVYRKGACVRIDSPDSAQVPCQTDGDIAGHLPIDCGVLPGALRLRVHPNCPLPGVVPQPSGQTFNG